MLSGDRFKLNRAVTLRRWCATIFRMSYVGPKTSSAYPWYLRLLFRWQKRRFGQVVVPMQIWGRQPVLLRRFMAFFRALERISSPVAPDLRAMITVRVSQINHCAFCVDFNSKRVLDRTVDGAAKLDALETFRQSDCLAEREKASLVYAEGMTRTDDEVTQELIDALRPHYDDNGLVELTAPIAFQNLSSKFNAALDLPAQGFCKLR